MGYLVHESMKLDMVLDSRKDSELTHFFHKRNICRSLLVYATGLREFIGRVQKYIPGLSLSKLFVNQLVCDLNKLNEGWAAFGKPESSKFCSIFVTFVMCIHIRKPSMSLYDWKYTSVTIQLRTFVGLIFALLRKSKSLTCHSRTKGVNGTSPY